MKTGLFFGTFNPIHTGHLIIAQYFINFGDLDKILFIVSPHNPLKNKEDLIDANTRLEMVRLSIEDNDKFEVSAIEFQLPLPSYTFQTLEKLKEEQPDEEFIVLMGSDSLATIEKWKNFNYILDYFKIYVYPRFQSNISNTCKQPPNIIFFDAPQVNISATLIRQHLKANKSIKYLVLPKIEAYIKKANII